MFKFLSSGLILLKRERERDFANVPERPTFIIVSGRFMTVSELSSKKMSQTVENAQLILKDCNAKRNTVIMDYTGKWKLQLNPYGHLMDPNTAT